MITSSLRVAPVSTLRFPLISRFYKAHYPTGKPKKDELIFSLETANAMLGVVRFRQFDDCQFLLGLAIHRDYRNQGLGTYFLSQLQPQLSLLPCYGFVYPTLENWYYRAGFHAISAQNLPPALITGFTLYQGNGKTLLPMQYTTNSALG